jgi:hypothetical protein
MTTGDTAFLSNPKFWETYPEFFSNEDRLLEFAQVIGVTAEFIKEKRRAAPAGQNFEPHGPLETMSVFDIRADITELSNRSDTHY